MHLVAIVAAWSRLRPVGVAALLGLAAGPALANDSTAELGAGGVQLVRTDAIELLSEDLYISADQVRVTYHFHNKTGAPVTYLVAFPLPDIDMTVPEAENLVIPDDANPNFVDFAVTVDGLSRPKVTDGTHTVEASVRVHAGSADQITIEVEYGDLAVYHDGDLQFRRNLGTASSIRVAARPSSGSTSILVNDKPVGSVDTAPHPPGGVALTMRRGDKATQPAPVFSGLTIGRSADGAGQDGS